MPKKSLWIVQEKVPVLAHKTLPATKISEAGWPTQCVVFIWECPKITGTVFGST